MDFLYDAVCITTNIDNMLHIPLQSLHDVINDPKHKLIDVANVKTNKFESIM